MSDDLPTYSRNLIPAPQAGIRRAEEEVEYFYEREAEGVNLKEVLGILRRNLWLILSLMILGLLGAGLLLYLQKPHYEASAVIRFVDTRSEIAGVLASEDQGGQQKADPILSELIVLEGQTLLGRVVDSLGLRFFDADEDGPADFVVDAETDLSPNVSRRVSVEFGAKGVTARSRDRQGKAAYGAPLELDGITFTIPSRGKKQEAEFVVVTQEKTLRWFKESLGTKLREGTNSVEVSFTATDRKLASRVVNAVIRAYKDFNLQAATQDATRRRVFFENRLRESDSLLAVTQAKLGAFRRSEQTYAVEDRFAIEVANLIQVETRQAELKANRWMYEALLNGIQQARISGQDRNLGSIVSMPEMAQDPVVSELYGQLVGYRTALDTLTTGQWARAETNPEVQQIKSLVQSTEQRLIDAARTHISFADAQIQSLDRVRGRAMSEMSRLSGAEVEELLLVQKLESLLNTSEELREQYQAARLEEVLETGDVEIVDLALSAPPVKSNPFLKIALGLVSGLILGGGVAFAREKLNDRIHRQEEIEDILQVRNLAVIPKADHRVPASLAEGNGRKVETRLPGGTLEAFRSLRTNLMFSGSEVSPRTLVVTSAVSGEGKTLTAINLGVVCAQQGRRILLVDADLRRPKLASFFGEIGDDIDLTQVLLNGRDSSEAIRSSGIDGLDVLLASSSPANASELLGGATMNRMLEELAQRYDMVILDSPPLMAASDAAVLGVMADGVLLVVRAGHADRAVVQQAIKQLSMVGAVVVGAVLNDPDGEVPRYKNRYYYDQYEPA